MSLLMTAKAAQRVENSGNDLADVCSTLSACRRGKRLMHFNEAKAYARSRMKENSAIRAMCFVLMRADDSIELGQFGRRGGYKRITRLWDRTGEPV